MPTPVTMYKAADGTLFDDVNAAVKHEQHTYIQTGATPLFTSLLTAADWAKQSGGVDELAAALAAALAADHKLAASFKVFFDKAPVAEAPAASARPKRVRSPRKKKTGAPTAPDGAPTAPEVPPVDASPAAPAPPEAYEPPPATPSDASLDAIGELGADPIEIPPVPGGAPPPPTAPAGPPPPAGGPPPPTQG